MSPSVSRVADPLSSELRIDGGRLWESLMEIGEIGGTPDGGCTRLALTEEDRRGRALFERWATEAGCQIEVDQIGNLFARRAGSDPDAAAVAVGSHLDTQPNGGRFDGIWGVLAGLELVRTLNDRGVKTTAPIDVVVWSNEEGARFPYSCSGASVWSGAMSLEEGLGLRALDGPTYGEELAARQMAGSAVPGERRLDSLFEAHIEQGPELDDAGIPVGIVEAVRGIRWLDVTFRGREGHAGSTMDGRGDALVGAARLIERVQAAASAIPGASGTVGRLEVEPNVRSVVPGFARATVDIRHRGLDTLDQLQERVRRLVEEIADGESLEASITRLGDGGPEELLGTPTEFDHECIGLLRDAAEQLGYPAASIVSPAGHDACYAAQVIPTAMVMAPCRGGVSHSPLEYAEPEHLEIATNVLLHAVLKRAGVAGQPGEVVA